MIEEEFRGVVGRYVNESTPHWPAAATAPAGAPNVVFIVLDDVGFSDLGCFGGEIHTPNMDRLAARGLRYNNFHTTALCSPTRACLLTGRNHHSVGMGVVSNWDTGFPGSRGRVALSAGVMVAPSQQARSARRTDRRRMEVGEPQTAPRDLIDVGCPYLGSVAAEVGEADVVENDEHNVGAALCGSRRLGPPRSRFGDGVAQHTSELTAEFAHVRPHKTRRGADPKVGAPCTKVSSQLPT